MELQSEYFILHQLRSRSFARPKHHLITLQPFPGFPMMKIPVLHLIRAVDGREYLSPFSHTLDYCSFHPRRSETWHRSIVKIVGLAWDFHIQSSKTGTSGNMLTDAKRFIQCVRSGSICFDGVRYSDPLELYWKAPSEKLGHALLARLRQFLAEIEPDFGVLEDPFARFLSAMQRKDGLKISKAGAFSSLSHLSNDVDKNIAENTPSIWRSREPLQDGIDGGALYRFPKDLWLPMLQSGYLLNSSGASSLTKFDATGRAHAALLSLGVRQSTPFHLWIDDVAFSGTGFASVTLRHPEEYLEPSTGKRRKIILQEMGFTARNRVHGRFHAGWKNLKLQKGYFAPTVWLPDSQQLGSEILRDYILNVREPIMAERRILGLPDHPFLLVSTSHDPSKGQFLGDPYTRKAAQGSWVRAITRLSALFPAHNLRVRKDLGTTMHGVRHLMGFSCVEAGLSLSDIADVLHQRSPLSALVYIRRSPRELSAALNDAARGNPAVSADLAKDAEALQLLRGSSIRKKHG